MLRHIKNLLSRSSLIIAIICTAIIAFLSLVKLGKQPVSFAYLDKVEHSLAYFFLTLFWLVALAKNRQWTILIAVVCFLYGIIIEILQVTLTTYRTAEYADALANTIGVLFALLVFNFFFKKKQSN